MFWDFGSLHQKHRDEFQEVLFKTGLKSSNIWYGSTQSTVWNGPQFKTSCCRFLMSKFFALCLHLERCIVILASVAPRCTRRQHVCVKWFSGKLGCQHEFYVFWRPRECLCQVSIIAVVCTVRCASLGSMCSAFLYNEF